MYYYHFKPLSRAFKLLDSGFFKSTTFFYPKKILHKLSMLSKKMKKKS
jgi:hypothetical protein